MRTCVRAYVRVSFNQVEVALHINFHSLFPAPFNNSYFIHNCLLCMNPGNGSPLVFKMKNLMYEAVNTYIVMYTVYKVSKCV